MKRYVIIKNRKHEDYVIDLPNGILVMKPPVIMHTFSL